jgi:hypothetical protein
MEKVIVLKSSRPYSSEYDPLLIGFIEQGIDLFAVTGVDCEEWEEAMDWICVDLDISGKLPDAFCNTTSHPGQSLEEVIAFAKQWCSLNGWPEQISVVEI